ncbi:DUF1972 domain-containing protein [Pedobacter punctiformis]|uniref:DUF1972 domain-containing protein n=1 Tax=Pedobacter punctiformis TaxID=3004097 RepID=A0ABT4L8V6_9SPHI|nr:DUF1972 domain-containing protein [Pedobacter sp. HCMS5-2]MCZ4244142.1 DUF1972 domain-containing protein [Pedobacter sp. HCMS5-2]
MQIAILGTRGIPNHYGGFEQFAEYLALGLVKRGHEVIVYNSHNHPYKETTWNGVKLIHIFDPEFKFGTIGQFIYDFNCIRNLKKHNLDVILQLGYTSSSVWYKFLPGKPVLTTNMDGLEWKRTKFGKLVRKFLLFAEKLAVKSSDHLISDSIGIQKYISKKYNVNSTYIPYGAHSFDNPDENKLDDYNVSKYQYNMLVARLEPENSIETILDGMAKSDTDKLFLVIGKHQTKYGEYLKGKYKSYSKIKFIGGVYDIEMLNNLRYFSNLYFHGHTVGGTNPSLLEAMASSSLISANDNDFNRYILGDDALYFTTPDEVAEQLNDTNKSSKKYLDFVINNNLKIKEQFNWPKIIDQYEHHFFTINTLKKSKLQIHNEK